MKNGLPPYHSFQSFVARPYLLGSSGSAVENTHTDEVRYAARTLTQEWYSCSV